MYGDEKALLNQVNNNLIFTQHEIQVSKIIIFLSCNNNLVSLEYKDSLALFYFILFLSRYFWFFIFLFSPTSDPWLDNLNPKKRQMETLHGAMINRPLLVSSIQTLGHDETTLRKS